MKVAIAGGSVQELEAVREAWPKVSRHLPGLPGDADQPALHQYDVKANDLALPLTLDALLRGAMERADNLALQLRRERSEADFYIGFQTGFHVVNSMGPRRLVFLETWAYVTDGHRSGFGHSAGIQIPPRVADPVIDRGIDLDIVLDRVSGELKLPGRQGLWALLGREALADRDACATAFLAAFAPFFNAAAYK